MHDFRRRPEDLKPEQQEALEALFEKVPTLGLIHSLRWQATRIFDTAKNVKAGPKALREWIAEPRMTELD